MSRHASILETIGRTPLVRLARLAPPDVNLYVKVEAFNPMGSVKDRMALAVIEAAERSGALRPGQTVIEATSGNTGIGLAMVCARKGYPLVVTMAESFSLERRRLLRFLGARVVLTPASEKGSGMLAKAIELAEAHGYFLCRQFENEANAEVHSRTTAREILDDMQGESIHAWVTGFGTGGTLKGVSRVLKAADPTTRVVVAEPDNAPLLGSGEVQPQGASHPRFRPHLMQGWSPDFISPLTQQAVAAGMVDEVVPVAGEEALRLARELARKEGIFVGISAGATLAAALQVARRAPAGSHVVCMLPDTGERYQSTPLFEGIADEMNEEELALSRSTPGYRFDAPAPVAQPPAIARLDTAQQAASDVEAERRLDACLAQAPVVMFSLAWCEFCWAARKLFERLGVDVLSVDLDSPACQADDMGVRLRPVLARRTGAPTIPQIFIGGKPLGGCGELFEAWADGSLGERLAACGVAYDGEARIAPDLLLPAWLHPRSTTA
ncbi:cysteine synthase A [Halomonas sp. MCCC 1A17488]|uniref:cysteine synthase n=1 Tax=Billgrantia sulfidoxydans TaxID=2733484 RepID=A0ABX7W321_9GAMM|nr:MULTISPECIES: cysteine synthase A [Halomonas]MCE8015474.1 cysteine synthase A [Halomonas sp. MCCC 1A17488]MCG3238807.1 cysteine synthase A [Halomonas sp. MCCC 1A17488]QPP51231.1 cysteine synthase A [Halomonas sp. SS10-MC5]QTP54788.1 cysteine synthase A [Halomonas sulfidoxydans]